MKAYYFQREDGCLAYGDGRKVKKGITHTVADEPVLCEYGLHASKHPFDALQHAFSSVLWEVKLSGVIVEGEDKCAATERTYLRCIDAEALLREFAREQALSVIHLWDAPQVVIKYLKTGDDGLRAAAMAAARAAAWAAAEAAAWAAAEAAAWDAAWAAAWAAAEAAAWDAARAAAWDAARDSFKQKVTAAFDALEA